MLNFVSITCEEKLLSVEGHFRFLLQRKNTFMVRSYENIDLLMYQESLPQNNRSICESSDSFDESSVRSETISLTTVSK